MSKEEIFEKAHLNESSDMARIYFSKLGIEFKDLKMSDYYKLSEFIQEEIYPLLADKTYSMVGKLRMNSRIRCDKDYVYLNVDGYYFDKREAISFNLHKNFIGFCGWADGCNRIPFIKGFIKWCDYLESKKEQEV